MILATELLGFFTFFNFLKIDFERYKGVPVNDIFLIFSLLFCNLKLLLPHVVYASMMLN